MLYEILRWCVLCFQRKKKRNSEVFRNVNLKEVLTTELVGQRLAIEQVSSGETVNRELFPFITR